MNTSSSTRSIHNYKKIDHDMPPSPVEWLASAELGYALDDNEAAASPVCFYCAAASSSTKLLKCAKCCVASYCNKDCQSSDWKKLHKRACASYQRLAQTAGTSSNFMILRDDDAHIKDTVRTELFGKVRFYACPYAVHQTRTLGKGFLFVQSTGTLATMSLRYPQDAWGRVLPKRSLLVHFLTMGEFDVEVCRQDFELATLRAQLKEAVDSYDPEQNIILLMRFRCGHLAVGVAPLVTDYDVCLKLGKDYFAQSGTDPLQLDIDDVMM